MKLIITLILALCLGAPSFAGTGIKRPALSKNKRPVRILFLGNSFTYFHDLYLKVAELTGGETKQNVKGGAFLSEQLDVNTDLGKRAAALFKEQKWDYVVLQEQSSGPMLQKERFQSAADELCRIIRENGATPVFYCTWPYRDGSDKLKQTGKTYGEMFVALTESYHEAAERNNALAADVGTAFYNSKTDFLEPDAFHPNTQGTALAAEVISEVILKDFGK